MIEKLKLQIKELQEKIIQIQNECSHPQSCITSRYVCTNDEPQGFKKYKEEGIKTYHCSLCDKTWSEIV